MKEVLFGIRMTTNSIWLATSRESNIQNEITYSIQLYIIRVLHGCIYWHTGDITDQRL